MASGLSPPVAGSHRHPGSEVQAPMACMRTTSALSEPLPPQGKGNKASRTLLLITFALGQHRVAPLFHGLLDELVVGVEVVIKAQEVELRVPGLPGFQHDFKLRPLSAHEAGSALDDGMHFGRGRLGENTNSH